MNTRTTTNATVPARRSHLVSVALRLFRDRGFHATGIDTILAESGVAKRTLYLHFRSKEELIVAVLVERDRQWRDWFRKSIARRASSPKAKLLAIFDALEEWFERPDFHGCMFINAAAEFPRVSDPIHREAARHQQLVREFVLGLAESAGAPDPVALAEGLCLLMEGAIVMAQATGESKYAREARRSAAILSSWAPTRRARGNARKPFVAPANPVTASSPCAGPRRRPPSAGVFRRSSPAGR